MKKKIKRLFKKAKSKIQPQSEAEHIQDAPKITADTVEEHREEVLSSARKFIYPLQLSKQRIVFLSLSIFIITIVSFFIYSVLALYRYNVSNKFMYSVTKVIPFPIAKTGKNYVAYENYLFELRRYIHYYTTQQKLNFDDENGRQQLANFRKSALEKVVNDTIIKQIASEKGITVSDEELDNLLTIVREQHRLGGSDKAFNDVLREFWDWSDDDFRRMYKQQLLTQKVLLALDTETEKKANDALAALNGGADFGALAKQVSEDEDTKANGGEFGYLISKNNPNITPQTIDVLFKLKPGEYSGIINAGYGLEIVKVIGVEDGKVKAARILFNFQDINNWLNDQKDRQKVTLYLKLPE